MSLRIIPCKGNLGCQVRFRIDRNKRQIRFRGSDQSDLERLGKGHALALREARNKAKGLLFSWEIDGTVRELRIRNSDLPLLIKLRDHFGFMVKEIRNRQVPLEGRKLLARILSEISDPEKFSGLTVENYSEDDGFWFLRYQGSFALFKEGSLLFWSGSPAQLLSRVFDFEGQEVKVKRMDLGFERGGEICLRANLRSGKKQLIAGIIYSLKNLSAKKWRAEPVARKLGPLTEIEV